MKGCRKELLVIIPAYNEELNIGTFLDSLRENDILSIADVLVIDDGSTDRTLQVVREKGVHAVSHDFTLGYGSSLQTGYKYAVNNGYTYLIQMDADGQHDACNVQRIYDCLKEADEQGEYPDLVLGSRFVDGAESYRISGIKKLAQNMFKRTIRLATGQVVMDSTTGLQGLSRRAFGFYSRFHCFDDMYPDANMILQMLMLGFRVKEVPAVMHERTNGVSMHSGIKPFFYMFRMLFSIAAVWIRIRLYKIDMGATDGFTE